MNSSCSVCEEGDGKPDEAAAATKGLQQHKLRADWKQKRYQVHRANVVISSNDTQLHTSEISFVRPVMGTKTEVPGKTSEEKPKLKETRQCRVKWTIQTLESVDLGHYMRIWISNIPPATKGFPGTKHFPDPRGFCNVGDNTI